MRVLLTSIGSEIALILDPEIREALHLAPEDFVELAVKDDALIVRRAVEPESDPVANAFHQVVEHPDELGEMRFNSDTAMTGVGGLRGSH